MNALFLAPFLCPVAAGNADLLRKAEGKATLTLTIVKEGKMKKSFWLSVEKLS